MKDCANSGKIWKSGTGCIKASSDLDTTDYDKMVQCGDSAKIYDKSSNACVEAASSANCKLSTTTVTASGCNMTSCPSGSFMISDSYTTSGSHGEGCWSGSAKCLKLTCN